MNRADVVEDIKKFAPSSLKVTLRDGTDKAVAVPKSGNRWARTQQVLDALPWVTIECLDKDQRVLGVVDDDEDAEMFVEEAEGNLGMARVLLEVMRMAMKETRLLFQTQLEGMGKLMSSMADGNQAVVESYRLALQTQQQHLLAAPSGAPESAEMMQMMQMLMMAMQQQQKKVG